MRRALLLATLLAGRPAPGSNGQGDAPFRVDLDRRGEGAPVFRIPALAVTTRGTLLAAYDARPTMADVPGHIAVVMRRSTDGGRTWSARYPVRVDTAPLGFGDPSLLVDQQTGRVFVFHVASIRQGFFGASTGTRDDDPDVLHAEVSWSDDDGLTWKARRLTSRIKQPGWGGLFAASGAGIQLRYGPQAGRLVQPYVIRRDSATWAATLTSDDHGETWRMGALVGPGADEHKVVERSDGTLLLNSRARPWRLVARSRDGGETWSPLVPDRSLPDPANNGAIVRVHRGAAAGSRAARVLGFSNTADTARRANLTLRLSCDDGATWPHARALEPGPAGYSTLVTLPGDTLGVLYERGAYDAITFARVPLAWVGRCDRALRQP